MMSPKCITIYIIHFIETRLHLKTLKTLKAFIATVCQYNTIHYNVICLQNVYKINFFISKRLYIKTRGPNYCKL